MWKKSCLTDTYWFFTQGVYKLREQTSRVSEFTSKQKKKMLYTHAQKLVFFLISLKDDVHL